MSKRILLVAGITFPEIGGVSNYVDFLTKHLDNVEVLSFNFYNTKKSEVRLINGKKYYLLRKVYFNSTKISFFIRILLMAYFVRMLSRNKIIYAQDVGISGLSSLLSFKRFYLRFVGDWAYESYYANKLTAMPYKHFLFRTKKNLLLRMLSKIVFVRSQTIITPAHHLKDVLVNYYKIESKKIVVIPNFVNISFDEKKRSKKRPKSFIFIGRIISLKRLDLCIKCFMKIKNDHPGSILFIVGDGYLRNFYAQIIKELNLQGIVFTGNLPKRDLYDLLSRTEYLIITSDHEGIPFSVIEAGYFNVKIIARYGEWVNELKDYVSMCVFNDCDDVLSCIKKPFESNLNKDVFERFSKDVHLSKLRDVLFKGP